jgi:hypothetical protein
MGLEPLSGILLRRAANLTNHDNTLGFRIVSKSLEAVDEVGAVKRIPTDTNASGLA